MLFRWPGHEEGKGEPLSGEDAVTEFQEGLIANRGGGGGGGAEMDEERRRILEERERWENEKSEMRVQRDEDAYKRAMTAVDNQVWEIQPFPFTSSQQHIDIYPLSIHEQPCISTL